MSPLYVPQKWLEAFNAGCFIGWDKNTTGVLGSPDDPEGVNAEAVNQVIQWFFRAIKLKYKLGSAMENSLKIVSKPWFEAFKKNELLIIFPDSATNWELKDLRK
ncbi:MAG: hypothetical protein PHQ23_15635, partial [Candidatus Wallbacteria bacterium]|nr:hypothetical protein [Candidatus Wallbacteria bacterium]